jgi:hypothetical protein
VLRLCSQLICFSLSLSLSLSLWLLLSNSLVCPVVQMKDPEERHDLAASAPELVAALRAQLSVLKRGYFQNHDVAAPCIEPGWTRGWWGSSCACYVAAHVHGDNTSGPWLGPFSV